MSITKRLVMISGIVAILLLTAMPHVSAQGNGSVQMPSERSFSTKSLRDYRENPDYQYYREKPQPLDRKDKEEPERIRRRPLKAPTGPRGDFSGAAKAFFWVLIAGVVIFILYQLYKVNWKDVWKKKADQAVVEIDREEEVADIRDLEFDRLLQEAINEKRYRHAVRLLYLNSLKQLQEKALIQYKKDKTNYDYLRELKDQALKPHFSNVTFLFEYIWYGEFPVDLNHFNLARAGFMEFDQAVRGQHA